MILTQVFRTHDGALRRCAFENQHKPKWHFSTIRYLDGKLDETPLPDGAILRERMKAKRYTWQIERTFKGR